MPKGCKAPPPSSTERIDPDEREAQTRFIMEHRESLQR